MFVLLGIKDTIPVEPKTFGLSPAVTITDALNKKYANKLIPEKGLALSVFDILTAEDGKVTWGNGLMYYKVTFRLLLFAPFHSEIIIGRVIASTPDYVRVSIGFFNDIYITRELLPPNSALDRKQNSFFWYADAEDSLLSPEQLLSTVVSQRLYIEVGMPIRFRVDTTEWQDIRPDPPVIHDPGAVGDGPDGERREAKDPYKSAGYKILATIAESGLGVVGWWDGSGGEDEAPMDES